MQIEAGGNVATVHVSDSIVDEMKAIVAQMVANSSYEVRPTAIYANPVLLDLIDREMKEHFNVALSTVEVAGGLRVRTIATQAGDLPLIPEWALGYTGVPGSGTAVLPAYIVSEDVSLAHRSQPARVPTGHDRIAGVADGGGEVRRRGSQGRALRASQGERGAPFRNQRSHAFPGAAGGTRPARPLWPGCKAPDCSRNGPFSARPLATA